MFADKHPSTYNPPPLLPERWHASGGVLTHGPMPDNHDPSCAADGVGVMCEGGIPGLTLTNEGDMPQTYTFSSDVHKNLQFLRMWLLFLQHLRAWANYWVLSWGG